MGQDSFDENESRPFVEAATKKGLSLSFGDLVTEDSDAIWPLDMDLVRTSLENAILRARQRELGAIAERLERLRSAGTPVQQVDFVLGSARVYYFPEDIERMVKGGPKTPHKFSLHPFSWLRCRALHDGAYICEERHNQICLVMGSCETRS